MASILRIYIVVAHYRNICNTLRLFSRHIAAQGAQLLNRSYLHRVIDHYFRLLTYLFDNRMTIAVAKLQVVTILHYIFEDLYLSTGFLSVTIYFR